jgi:hypothetical protein
MSTILDVPAHKSEGGGITGFLRGVPEWIGHGSAVVLVVLFLVTLISTALEILRSPSLDSLKADKRRLTRDLREQRDLNKRLVDQARALPDKWVRLVADQHLHLTDRDRITIYLHEGSTFFPVARYSKHPPHCERSRKVYPATQGVIAEAWTGGECLVTHLPVGPAAWNKAARTRWNIPAKVARDIRMKSRWYAGFAMEHPKGKRFAVVIVESLDTAPKHCTFDSVKQFLDSQAGSDLREIIIDRAAFGASPALAHREEY